MAAKTHIAIKYKGGARTYSVPPFTFAKLDIIIVPKDIADYLKPHKDFVEINSKNQKAQVEESLSEGGKVPEELLEKVVNEEEKNGQ